VELGGFIPDTRVVLVVPPLAHLSWPSLGVHAIQSSALAAGHDVGVAYLNLAFGARIGVVEYANLSNAPTDWLLGERLFAKAAFGLDALLVPSFRESLVAHNRSSEGRAERYLDHLSDASGEVWEEWGTQYDHATLAALSDAATALMNEAAGVLASREVQVVGVTTSFDQTNAAIALLSRVKAISPHIVTLMGGANCDGVMAAAVASVAGSAVDHVFQGESDVSFPRFLTESRGPPLIVGEPVADMDSLPCPVLDDYFRALKLVEGMREVSVWLAYETSRGCWWGEKRHCTFCGLNGTGLGFRARTSHRAAADLRHLIDRHSTRLVCMTDNIMPHSYHRTLIPRLTEAVGEAHIFYEQKANLSLEQVAALYAGGVRVIQPGIESLSTAVLQRMRKGVLARQNLALLRYCRSVGVIVKWNLLYGFPGESRDPYVSMRDLMPLISHLPPPHVLTHLSIDRFSPYFDQPERYGISMLRPLPAYEEVFPPFARLHNLAYHFVGEWDAESLDDPPLMAQLWNLVRSWRNAWAKAPAPALQIHPAGPGQWVLADTRGGEPRSLWLGDAQAAAVAVGGPKERVVAADWAIRNQLAVELDGWCVPLAVAPPEVLMGLERRFRVSDAADEEWITVLGR